ncbi:MAG: hypothetical protein ACJAS1_000832 [Oleiphilaceae bacterium]|jgi:hypothetical protein
MKHKAYIKIEVAIEVDSENENTVERKARDIMHELLPDELLEIITDMDVIRIAKVN